MIIRCEKKLTNIIRISDKSKLYDCDYPDCLRFFESMEKLNYHKYIIHSQALDPNMLKSQEAMMMQMQNKYPNMPNQTMMYPSMPQQYMYNQMMINPNQMPLGKQMPNQ
jgi:hypothetical protein